MISVAFNDELNKHKSVLHEAIGELEYLSSLHGAAGNDKLSGQLHWIKQSLEKSEATLSKSYSQALYEAVDGAEANSRAMLNAALAGAKIAKEHSK